jgi:uncharacterized protein YndB with AHSA1/START domain
MTDPVGPGPQPLRIVRTFTAPIQRVFDAWTSVDVLRRWWPAGRDWEPVVAEVEVRVGGRLRLVVRTPDGSTYGGEGRYLELRPPNRLVFTWRWDDPAGRPRQTVDVTFTDNRDGTTTVVLVNAGIAAEDLDNHGRGWQLSFDNLQALFGDVAGRPL